MKILVVGDFHGKIPKKLKKLAIQEKVDLVVSLGDYLPFSYRKLWFKHCYHKDVELWDVIGKKKYQELVSKDLESGKKILHFLNNLGIPVFTTLGNVDYNSADDVRDEKDNFSWKWAKKEYLKVANLIPNYSNISRIDYSYRKFKDVVFIGMRGHSFPGLVKTTGFRKHKKILENLFNKFSKENKEHKVIFVSHNVPYNTKLDKAHNKAIKDVAGKHIGSKLTRKIIEKEKPVLVLAGHMHENQGKQKLGNSLVVNPGEAGKGKFAIVDFDEENGKVRDVKFYN